MNAPITVRLAREEDAAELVDFNLEMAWETEKKRLSRETVQRGVENLLREPRYGFYVVAEVPGRLAGGLMVTYEWTDWRDGLFWWIQSVYVKPEFRGQKVYSRLYRFLQDQARKNPQIRGFRLYVEAENSQARQIYRHLGMKETRYVLYEELWQAPRSQE